MSARGKHLLKRAAVLAIAAAQIFQFLPPKQTRIQYAFAASGVTCPTVQGNYVAGGTLGAGLNSYWQPAAGTLAAGSTTVNLGTLDTTGGSSSTGVKTGDELLIIQMQDGSFNTTNSSAYGDGTGTGHGFTTIGNAGLYEYVSVSSASGTQTSGTVTIQGTGSGGGLLNSYYENTANGQRYQIVRVPQYTTATLSGNFTARYWDGNTGGIAAIDMASTLNLNGASVYATGDGFRGGGYSVATTSPTSVLNNDYVDSAAMNGTGQPAFGTKGEGIMGSPHAPFFYTTYTTPNNPTGPTVNPTPGGSDGYAGGDQGMGAPGNAGGGGTDDDPTANDQNSGGGGGGNGGAGGNGGYPWTPNYSGNTSLYSTPGVHVGTGYSAFNSGDIGGRGGAALSSYVAVGRAFMGGGGGAGANNNGSDNNSYNAYGSSGGVGGGIILMRLSDTSGTPATIYANGTTGLAPNNDGGGGGGAGGTVIVTSPNAFTGITVNVNGAAGTTADAAGGFPGNQHGPGGGGGGGIVLSTSNVSASATGGASGTTTPNLSTYGATAGASGYISQTVSASQVPGLASGAECYSSSTTGTSSIYTGPYSSAGGTNFGIDYTGSYDGQLAATNNNDFTARAIPLVSPSPNPINSSTNALAPIGNSFSVSSAPSLNVENGFYYQDTGKNNAHTLSITATAPILPAQWTARVCPDNGGAPNCGFTTVTGCAKNTHPNAWLSAGTAGATSTAQYCYSSGTGGGYTAIVPYWVVYTGPTGTYTAFARYDALVEVTDDQTTPATNKTHNELYAGFVPVAKTSTTLSNGNCPANITPPAQGVCPGGTIKYSLQYANIVAGGGIGTEGQDTEPFVITGAGSLVISDNGTSGPAGTNWAQYTGGLLSAVTDTTASTACTYNGGGAFVAGATNFACTIGGSSFRLYPSGFTGQTSSGTLNFQVKVK